MNNDQPMPPPNQTPPPDPSQTSGPVNLPPAAPAANSPNADQEPKKPLSKYTLLAIGAGGFLLLLIIIVLVVALAGGKKSATKKSANQFQDNKSNDELETVVAKDIYVDKIKYDLSITTPHGWGTQQNNNVIAGVYPWEGAKFLTSFRFRDAQFSVNARTITANNYIALQDITGWISTDKNNYPLSAYAKRNNFDILGSLGNADVASPEIMAKIINPRSGNEIAGRIKPQIIKAANGSVNGVAYLTVTNPEPVYIPRLILLMAGTVNNRQVYLYGDIAFTDQLKVSLDKQKAESDPDWGADNAAAFNDFKAGKLTAELQKFYEDAIIAFKSIKIERTNTDNLIN